jgi:tellurite resistance protein TehA-like permease
MIRIIGFFVGIFLVLGTIYVVGKWVYRLIKKVYKRLR